MKKTTQLTCGALVAALLPTLVAAQSTSQSQGFTPTATAGTGARGAPATPARGSFTVAAPGDLYAAAHVPSPTAPGASILYTLNKATGAATMVGPIGFNGVSGLAVLNDGRLVASATDGSSSLLINIDRTTGVGALIGTIGAFGGASTCERVGGLTYDSNTNTLWGMGDRCAGSFSLDTLLVIDTITGAGTAVSFGAHSSGFFLGTAWDPSTSTLYSNDGSFGLLTIDPTTSIETLIGGPGSSNGMAIDGTGIAYGTTNANDLITIDLATGNETVVGNTGLTGLDGLVFDIVGGPGCPPVTATTTPRVGTVANPNVFSGASAQPLLGTNWDPKIDHTTFEPGSVLDFAGLSAASADLSLPPFGSLLCALPFFAVQTVAPGAAFSYPIPFDCALAGLAICTQAGSISPGAIRFTNALDLVIGTI